MKPLLTATALTPLLLAAAPAPTAGRAVVTQYHSRLAGRRMASGRRYHPHLLIVASRHRRDLGRGIVLTRGRHRVTATVADLGRLPVPRGFGRGRRFDASTRVARRLGLKRNENAVARWRWVRRVK